ncbi:ornithine cyclodeaminase family protein [Aquamicrobium sp. LC103]|uniref:ornithine cyclodeaminase family protein n=1 Tax=Aquamicrobium sp. LC103 TaxID=1120658 RepID=UPI00063EAE64|nr:ornithine cyclodeaminase family protein [Aquamicrobium sp. LC103]TKT69274.1 ornithine cyclodeaminase family protein [Aquamicrobium sp. LC103]
MIVLSREDVEVLLPPETAIEVVAMAMAATSRGEAELPLRSTMAAGGPNMMGIMPGMMRNPPCHGIKLVSLFPGNAAAGYSSHQGAMVLFESEHGTAIAIMDGGPLTALRTAAASAVATRALSRENSAVLAMVGAGEQARHHLDAMIAIRPITELRVASRTEKSAANFAEYARSKYPHLTVSSGTDVRATATGADIVCTVTSAPTPILQGAWISRGTHLNVVGASIPSKREIDDETVLRAQVFADYRHSTFVQAGEIVDMINAGTIGKDHIVAEIGEVLNGGASGRTDDQAITLYRSLGIATQDIACAYHCWDAAQRTGRGVDASL